MTTGKSWLQAPWHCAWENNELEDEEKEKGKPLRKAEWIKEWKKRPRQEWEKRGHFYTPLQWSWKNDVLMFFSSSFSSSHQRCQVIPRFFHDIFIFSSLLSSEVFYRSNIRQSNQIVRTMWACTMVEPLSHMSHDVTHTNRLGLRSCEFTFSHLCKVTPYNGRFKERLWISNRNSSRESQPQSISTSFFRNIACSYVYIASCPLFW